MTHNHTHSNNENLDLESNMHTHNQDSTTQTHVIEDTIKPKKKTNLKLLVGLVVLLLLVLGSSVGFYLSQSNQELRKDASEASCNSYADSDNCGGAGCFWQSGKTNNCTVSQCQNGFPGTCGAKPIGSCVKNEADSNAVCSIDYDKTECVDVDGCHWDNTPLQGQVATCTDTTYGGICVEKCDDGIFCGDCIQDCRSYDHTCNEWIELECNDGGGDDGGGDDGGGDDGGGDDGGGDDGGGDDGGGSSSNPLGCFESSNAECGSNNNCELINLLGLQVCVPTNFDTSTLPNNMAVCGMNLLCGEYDSNLSGAIACISGGEQELKLCCDLGETINNNACVSGATGGSSGTGSGSTGSGSTGSGSTGNNQNLLGCNGVCNSSSECQSGLSCFDTYNYSANSWSDQTGNVSSVGSGTITSFKPFVKNGIVEQHMVRGGQVWYRPNLSASWSNITADFSSVGSGTITSFGSYVDVSGNTNQWLTRSGQVWYRPNLSASWSNITADFSSVGSGTITAYIVDKYSANHGNIVNAYLVKGNQVWQRTSSNWSAWINATANLTMGSGDFSSVGMYVNTSTGSINHNVVRGGTLWYKESPLASEDKCRLPAYPNSGTCSIPVQ